MIPPNLPVATVTKTIRTVVYVHCPFCGSLHRHEGARSGMTEWRSAGCALNVAIPRAVRATGYTFNTSNGKN